MSQIPSPVKISNVGGYPYAPCNAEAESDAADLLSRSLEPRPFGEKIFMIPNGRGASGVLSGLRPRAPKKPATSSEDWAASSVEIDGRACHVGGAV